MRVVVRVRSRAGLHDSDVQALVGDGDLTRIVLGAPERVVAVLVDGVSPNGVRARTQSGDRFELAEEPAAELGGVRLPRPTLLTSELELDASGAEQIEIQIDNEVHALRGFARAHGLDFQDLAYGRESFDQFHGYRILQARPETASRIEAVAISRPAGRFGNHLMQLVHATHAALALGVDTVYVPPMPWFEPSSAESRDFAYIGYSDLEDISVPAFFATFLFEDLAPAVPVLEGELRQRLVDRHVSSLFTPPPLGEQPRPPNHIAVHIRSGDLFDRPDPHPNFVQPPLAYYTLALEHFASEHPQAHVTLVYEGEGNPVIPALRDHLEAAGIRHAVSSSTLAHDLGTLLEHRSLVLSRGSFGVAVASLSANVERLYVPWSEPRFPGLVLQRGLKGHLIEEIEPGYIEPGRWLNSAGQRRLMVEYPAANLAVGRIQ